jgi:hypothetical protein
MLKKCKDCGKLKSPKEFEQIFESDVLVIFTVCNNCLKHSKYASLLKRFHETR